MSRFVACYSYLSIYHGEQRANRARARLLRHREDHRLRSLIEVDKVGTGQRGYRPDALGEVHGVTQATRR